MTQSNTYYLYAPNRTPTGIADAILVQAEPDGTYTYLSETTPGARHTLATGVSLYASREDAIEAARFQWVCNGEKRGAKRPPRVTVS